MNRRRAIAVLALVGALDAAYLLLVKLGVMSGYVCTITSGGCDVVNTSRFSEFLGVPVAAIGLAGYVVLLAGALAGLQPALLADRRPDLLLTVFSGVAVAFTLYLTYAELFILHAVCQWCVVSQVIIIAIFVLAVIGVRPAVGKSGAG